MICRNVLPKRLDFKGKGKANVRVQWIGNAPLNDQGSHLAMMNKKANSGASMGTLIAAIDGPSNAPVQVAEAEATYQEATFEAPKKKKRARGEAQIVQVGAFKTLERAEVSEGGVGSNWTCSSLRMGNGARTAF